MSNNKILEHIIETMTHKEFVIKACLKMAGILISEGNNELAAFLLQRANIHDNSKLVGPELELLSELYGNQESFINPEVQLSESDMFIVQKEVLNSLQNEGVLNMLINKINKKVAS